jgi:hypothetical protein
MSDTAKSLPKLRREATLYEMEGLPIYGRPGEDGKARKIDTIDQDEARICRIADHLQRRGYGVVRERNPRSGKVYHTLKAVWLGPGDPPDDPTSDA